MSEQDAMQPSPAALPPVPPTQPGAIPLAQPRSLWPTVLGIVAVILAGLGLLSLMWQMAALLFGVGHAPATQPAAGQPSKLALAVLTPAHTILVVVLLAGGIGLLRRRRWSARALLAWGIADAVLTVAALTYTLLNMPQVQEQMRRQNPAMQPMAGNVAGAFFLGIMCFGMVVGLTPPVFAIVWFRRANIRSEVAAWA